MITWLEKHPRFRMHFTPTGSSWVNLIELFFGEFTQDVIRYGSFSAVHELVEDIEDYIAVEQDIISKTVRIRRDGYTM